MPSLLDCAVGLSWLERCACCDLDRARAERVRLTGGFARAYSDAATMLARERPDAVAVVVPPAAMVDVAGPVLAAGVAALIEKPPGLTAADVDALARAAAGRSGRPPTPHQVAFNRRFVPVVREARALLDGIDAPVQHVHYEITRVGRTDADFTTTAIHGIDAARFLAASDYAELHCAYVTARDDTPGVVNYFATGSFASGASVHLAAVPAAGVVVERAVVHAGAHTLFVQVPMWAACDTPRCLQHLHEGRLVADHVGPGDNAAAGMPGAHVLGGFLAQYLAFFEALHEGRSPEPDLAAVRQSVEVAEAMRHRRPWFRSVAPGVRPNR